jgi:hypothetical protein
LIEEAEIGVIQDGDNAGGARQGRQEALQHTLDIERVVERSVQEEGDAAIGIVAERGDQLAFREPGTGRGLNSVKERPVVVVQWGALDHGVIIPELEIFAASARFRNPSDVPAFGKSMAFKRRWLPSR